MSQRAVFNVVIAIAIGITVAAGMWSTLAWELATIAWMNAYYEKRA